MKTKSLFISNKNKLLIKKVRNLIQMNFLLCARKVYSIFITEHNTVMCTPIPTIGVDENRIIFIRFTEQELQKETSFRSKLKSLNILSFGVDSKLEVGCRWLIIKYIGKDRKILNALNSISKSQGNPNPKWTEQWRIEPGHYYISTFDKILFREWIEEHKNEITSNFSSENVFTIHAEKSIVLPDIVSQYLPVHSETQPTVRPYLINEDCG